MGKRKSYPTIDSQTNKSLSHIIHLPSNQTRIILTTLQQLLMSSLSRYHTIVNNKDPQSCSNDAPLSPPCTYESVSSPSTPLRTSPDFHYPTHSSSRQEPRHANDAGAYAQSQCVASVHPKGSFPARRQTCYNPSGRTGWNCPPFPPFHSSCSHCVHTSDSREWCQRTIPSFMTSEPISINSLLRQFGPIQWWLWFLISFQIACIPMKQYWCQSDNPLLPFSRTIP